MEQNKKPNCTCKPTVSHVSEMCPTCLAEYVAWSEEQSAAEAHYAARAQEAA